MMQQVEVNFVEFSVDYVVSALQDVYNLTEPVKQLQMVQWLQFNLEVASANGLLSRYYRSAGVCELNLMLIELAHQLNVGNSPATHVREAIKAVKHDFARQTL
jgi:hypothetical protein